jgi:hypothetical protein
MSSLCVEADETHEESTVALDSSAAAKRSRVWHVTDAGNHFGPLAASEVEDLAALGQIGPQARVWRRGSETWQPLAAEAELQGAWLAVAPTSCAPWVAEPADCEVAPLRVPRRFGGTIASVLLGSAALVGVGSFVSALQRPGPVRDQVWERATAWASWADSLPLPGRGTDEAVRPWVGLAAATAGPVPREVLVAHLRAHSDELHRECWVPARVLREGNGETAAPLVVAFQLDARGRASHFRGVEPRGYHGLWECVAGRVERWSFPASQGVTQARFVVVFASPE